MAAEASERGPAGTTRLALGGFPESGRFAPQLLYPVVNHGFPAWLNSARAVAPDVRHPVIAICIDDLGEDIAGTDKAMALPASVALSFLPFAQTTPFLAAEAAHKNHEILAHVPMEALGAIDPGPMALKVGARDNAMRLAWNLNRVPGLSGFNNHEGSKFTADAASLIPVAKTAAARHLFFFDSRTTADSKIVATARDAGAVSAARDIFLDDDQSEEAVRKQLAALAAAAKRQGVAIAIGHPHDVTLKLLAAWLAEDHGVTLVPLSEAIRFKTVRETQFAAK
jgi:polysaccharide deacetylase 2 family uncharacterized protein YibQ